MSAYQQGDRPETAGPSSTADWTQCEHVEDGERCGLVAFTGHMMCPEHVSHEVFAAALGLDPKPSTTKGLDHA